MFIEVPSAAAGTTVPPIMVQLLGPGPVEFIVWSCAVLLSGPTQTEVSPAIVKVNLGSGASTCRTYSVPVQAG